MRTSTPTHLRISQSAWAALFAVAGAACAPRAFAKPSSGTSQHKSAQQESAHGSSQTPIVKVPTKVLVIEGDARDDGPERRLRDGLDEVKRDQIRLEEKLDNLLASVRDERRPNPRLEIAFKSAAQNEPGSSAELGLVQLDASLNEIPIVSMRRPLFLGRDWWSLPLFDGPAGRGTYMLRLRVTLGRTSGTAGAAILGRSSLEKDVPLQIDDADKKIEVWVAQAKAEAGKAPAAPTLEVKEL